MFIDTMPYMSENRLDTKQVFMNFVFQIERGNYSPTYVPVCVMQCLCPLVIPNILNVKVHQDAIEPGKDEINFLLC
jgi:hypothetical protein